MHYGVGIWTKYTGESIKEVCELRSFEVMDLYWQYVRRLDNLVDSSVGMGMFDRHSKAFKRHEAISPVVNEFVKWIHNSQLPRTRKRRLVSLFGDYRREVSFGVLADTITRQLKGIQRPAELIPRVEQISGRSAASLMRIFNIVHNVPSDVARRVEDIFFQWGIAYQIVDDLMDVDRDWNDNIYNLVISFLSENEDEMQRFIESKRRQQIRTPSWWIRNAPETHAAIRSLFDRYISNLGALDPNSKVVRDLQFMTVAALQIVSYRWVQVLQGRAYKAYATTVDGFPSDVAPNQSNRGQGER